MTRTFLLPLATTAALALTACEARFGNDAAPVNESANVSAEGKGPSIVVSRRSPELIKELFELEVPEIADDLVEIVGVAREPGFRSKIAVTTFAWELS